MELAALRRERRDLAAAVQLHETTLERFLAPERCWFVLNLEEFRRGIKDRADKRPGHLTSTASCYESLADTDIASARLPEDHADRAAEFAELSLQAHPSTWRSEGAADVYCRVRTLPAVIRFVGELDRKGANQVKRLLEQAWSTIDLSRPDDGGLAEDRLYNGKKRLKKADEPDEERERYPANAFHTYWGVKTVTAYQDRRSHDNMLSALAPELANKQKLAHGWAIRTVAEQTALIRGGAERVDPQQLAYALVTDHLCDDEPLTAGTQRYDLYDSALSAFFSTQLDSGKWPLSEPLFHYPEAGNAYCYTFETLTELLRPALPRERGRAYRELLRGHLPRLVSAWRSAFRTRVALEPDAAGELAYGWSSGHHLFRPQPEVWATASVFSFLQVLRCIVGHFTADAAGRDLRARPPVPSDRDEASRKLARRGQTWSSDGVWTVARRLASMFLLPRALDTTDPEIRDPDGKLIGEADARSAILFGPPGTGKSTLVQSLAGAIGWRFVEVQAAAFLSEGMDRVPARAEAIFDALMELDRCVVLFDEIDELIRSRGADETDPFGRFLTTSMLPKIARLWDQRRVLFFVATNHVNKADPAIRRSSRFDAAILVAPPSLAAKRLRLRELLSTEPPPIDEQVVHLALTDPSKVRDNDKPMGVLALLRYDQMSQLADYIRGKPDGEQEEALRRGLKEMASQLLRNEWRPERDDQHEEASELLELNRVYDEYLKQESEDRSKSRYIGLHKSVSQPVDGIVDVKRAEDGAQVGRIQGELAGLSSNTDGSVSLTASGKDLRDDGLLSFSPQT